MARIYDISLPIVPDGLVYPGNPPISITTQQSMAAGGSSNVSALAFGSHTGTHVDAPRHMIDGAAGVEALPLEVLMGPALVVDVGDAAAITAQVLEVTPLDGVQRILLRTRNSSFVREREFRRDYTYLAPDGAEFLASRGVRLVGIDYLSIEQFRSGHHRAHKSLLSREIVIIEGLDLSGVPAGTYELRCLPLRLPGLDGAPARAVLVEH